MAFTDFETETLVGLIEMLERLNISMAQAACL